MVVWDLDEELNAMHADQLNYPKGGETNQMTTIKEAAEAYVPKQTLNIADLEMVPGELDIKNGSGVNSDGKEFTYDYIEQDGKEYRVPSTVLAQLQVQLKENPKITKFKVNKEGSGLNTKYTVVPIL